jgi:hypothetical protein
MNFKEKLEKYLKDKTRVFINGEPDSEDQGIITGVFDDYIEFTMTSEKTEKNSGAVKKTVEVQSIPFSSIETVSTGMVKTETPGKGAEQKPLL